MRSEIQRAKRVACEASKQMNRIFLAQPDSPEFQMSPMARMQSGIMADIEQIGNDLGIGAEVIVQGWHPEEPTPEFE